MKSKVDDLAGFQAETEPKPLISNEFSGSTTMTDSQKQAVQRDAERAAQERQTPNEKCPHPFSSEQGRYWVACYWAEWNKVATPKPNENNDLDAESALQQAAPFVERRGK